MSLHRIRLRKPWWCEVAAGGLNWHRKFGGPSGLGTNETVWLCVEKILADGSVTLNGQLLGRLPGLGASARYDITSKLHPRNELQIFVTAVVMPAESACDSPGDVFLEIRDSLTSP